MRFIARMEDIDVAVRREEIAYRQLVGGLVAQEVITPMLHAQFDSNTMIPTHERMYALQVFMSGDPRPFGAMPEFQAQPIVDAMGRVVDMTSEYRPDLHFSVFDTETMCPPDLRDVYEQALLNNPSFGKDYILVEKQKITPPWPTYNDCDLATAVNMCRHGGFDLLKVLEYESAHQNREDWLLEIGKILAEKSIRKSEDDKLSLTIE